MLLPLELSPPSHVRRCPYPRLRVRYPRRHGVSGVRGILMSYQGRARIRSGELFTQGVSVRTAA